VKTNLYIFRIDAIFSGISYLQLVEFMDVEPTDIEGRLHMVLVKPGRLGS
jgi:hypothetical protein